MIDDLFDARLLHILKKAVTAHDRPGVRYLVYRLDYGCYVDLLVTAKAPGGLLASDESEAFIEVPPDDYRAIRRAILDIDEFKSTRAARLGSALKLGGRLTVQTKSDGALDLAASDYYGAEEGRIAGLRGYARANDDAVKALGAAPSFAALAGKGSLAITIEPRVGGPGGGQTYQGIVALSPDGIAASAQTYFEQSEQLPTAIRLAAAPVYEPGKPVRWRAGGLMLQSTPDAKRGVDAKDDEWERLKLFLETVEPFELVDTALPAEDLLWRLFHEDEVRVLPFEPLAFRCGCSAERISSVLRSYPQAQHGGDPL